ncbi:wax ester/triacylglycerol synthase family O-acyltransferase [Mycobacterium sp. B14F4]|uniref:wax ester/triacylglycerol synthase family O-acyltransferase n=1 Tax=Mycobacterium sp. B14F4 TaxID=3153565 RepID=UPI00325F51F5
MQLLAALDAAMMTAEVLASPLNIGVVLVMSRPPDTGPHFLDELHSADLAGRFPLDSRLRRHPHRGIETAGMWIWRTAGAVDLARHCRRQTLPPGSGRDQLWQLISELHAEPLDRSRPMWMSYLIDGFDDQRFAVYVKVHHTLMDGLAGIHMITAALSPDPDSRAMAPFYAEADSPVPGAPTPAADAITGRPSASLLSVPHVAAQSVSFLERLLTSEAATLLRSVATKTTQFPVSAPCTRFNGAVGHRLGVASGTWPKGRFSAVHHPAGVTTNDVITAVVGGVLRRWLQERDELPARSLVAICPITVRPRGVDGDKPTGNQFGAWLVPLGTDIADADERLDLIHRVMAEGKHRVAERGSAVSMSLLATSIAATVLSPVVPIPLKPRTGYNLPVSHISGPSHEMYWNGAHVEEIVPVSAVYDGQALNVTTCSYADRIHFGYVAGRHAVPDIEALVPLTEECLREVEEGRPRSR